MDKRVLEAIDLQLSNNIKKAKESYLNLIKDLDGFDLESVYINLGNIYLHEKKYEDTKECYEKALKINSKNEKTYFNLAMLYLTFKDLEKAKENFEEAISLNDRYLNAYINLGIVNKKLYLLDEAVDCFERALDINPHEKDIYFNYANVLSKKGQYNIALMFFHKALDKNEKDTHKIYYSVGLIYQHKGFYERALKFFDKSLKYKPDYYDALFAKATVYLILGDFKNGWEYYSYRWDATNELKRPEYKVTWYNGQDLKGKNILVQQEQGFGDNIQFIRYVPKLVELGANVYLALKDELHELFSTIPNIKIIGNNQNIENIDYFVSLLDLPKILYKYQDEFINKQSYLAYKEKKIFTPKHKDKINIGFVWRGNPAHKGDEKRSIELLYFEELFKNKKYDFYSLQYDNNEELNNYSNKYSNVFDCKPYIKNFNDTANIVSKLDLVITIDSSMVHLCGALGIKTWLILGKNSEWRWLLDKEDSIWYKSVKIFRQNNSTNLINVFNKIIFELKEIEMSEN